MHEYSYRDAYIRTRTTHSHVCTQCGNGGSTLTSPRFVYKLQSMNMTRICAGAQSSAAISSKGKLYVWGSNISQQKHSLPFEVPFPLKTKIVDVDAGTFTCV